MLHGGKEKVMLIPGEVKHFAGGEHCLSLEERKNIIGVVELGARDCLEKYRTSARIRASWGGTTTFSKSECSEVFYLMCS